MDRKKSILVAAIASLLIPGFGKLYLGKIKTSIFVFILYNLCAFLLFFFIESFYQFIISLSLIAVLYLVNIIHTIILARGLRNSKNPFKPKWYIYAGFLFIYLMVVYEIRKPLIEQQFSIALASIPTYSMNPTLFAGDHIAYKKTNNFTAGDIMVYYGMADSTFRYSHRLIGSPGDIIQLKKDHLVRNEIALAEKNIRLRFFIEHENLINKEGFLQQFNITDAFELDEKNMMIHIKPEDLLSLKKDPRILNLASKPLNNLNLNFNLQLFPNSSLPKLAWTLSDFGPLRVPSQGWVIQLDSVNSNLYQSCILDENSNFEFKDHQILDDGIALSSYKFKTDYYFVMGDNRYNSLDSRYIGFIPKRKTVGKVIYRYWSNDWDRIGTEF